MKELRIKKRASLERLLKNRNKDKIFQSFAEIISGKLPVSLWDSLSADDILHVLKDYVSFIIDAPPYKQNKGRILNSPKIRVYNPEASETWTASFKEDTTIVEIHVINKLFIYESVRNYFIKSGYRIIGAVHPTFFAEREGEKIKSVASEGEGEGELFVNLYIEREPDTEKLDEIKNDIDAILRCIELSVDDYGLMKEELHSLSKGKKGALADSLIYDNSDISSFLEWISNDNYVLLGIRSYCVTKDGPGYNLALEKKGRFGVFREDGLVDKVVPGFMREVEEILLARPDVKRSVSSDFCGSGNAVIYQLSPLEFFSVRHSVKGDKEYRLTVVIGRLTRGALHWRSDSIPLLKKKSQLVIENIGDGVRSFDYREARAIFNYMPKKELLYTTVDQLKDTIANVMSAESDDDVTIHVRIGDGGRYAMVMVTIARNDNSMPVRSGIGKLLAKTFDRPVASWYHTSSEARALLFYYFMAPEAAPSDKALQALAIEVKDISTGWTQRFYEALYKRREREAKNLYNRYIDAIDNLYRDSVTPEAAVDDIEKIEALCDDEKLQIRLHKEDDNRLTLKLYSLETVQLMEILRELENFGMNVTGEQAYLFKDVVKGCRIYVHYYSIEGEAESIDRTVSLYQELFEAMAAMKKGFLENDNLNRLLLMEGFNWRAIELLRTWKNYLLQINRTYDNMSVTQTMVRHSSTVKKVYDYFTLRLGAKVSSKKEMKKALILMEDGIGASLGEIDNLGDFQALNSLYEIAKYTKRTNFFIEPVKKAISIKIESGSITEAPAPKPLAEIYVHSPDFEGVHLRGGRVARGGLRWSDREDFRTEILGLMKTQMLKNSIIVPEGAKGGFLIKKKLSGDREEQLAEMERQYREFVSSLLDLTDNYLGEKEVPPKNVVVTDSFDPYLVVAADKGTAAMSDTANEISKQYNFWLGDAFASGGSAGYDHKKIGITARGAWESVKRHFRELGTNIQEETVTVVGIGDMAGDVFGNGMLLSEKMKLVGAFNHVHIFLDPDPDPAESFRERKRLFALPRSSWMDYDAKLISRGGGVFLRNARAVRVSEEMSPYLGIDAATVTGEEMIKLLLKARVDLLYNGGIGTYIKAKGESSLDVGDKVNDRVRVNGSDVRARVLGEGGNLGVTQMGRLEYSAAGGNCYTDAIDNSGGVNISDNEVNIKIMLNHLLEKGEIKDMEARNALLEEIEDEVAEKVIKNNYLQSGSCSMDFIRSKDKADLFIDVVDGMEKELGLNREEECVPLKQEIVEAIEKGETVFSKPMLAVLMGYQKMKYYNEIMDSDLVGSIYCQHYLKDYFPERISRDFESELGEHRLKKEIIATTVINRTINRAGITLYPTISKYTGKSISQITRGYIIIESILKADDFREGVYALDNAVPSELQYKFLMELEKVIAYGLKWFLKHQAEERISFDFILQYRQVVSECRDTMWDCILDITDREKLEILESRIKKLVTQNVPEALARKYVSLHFMKDVMDIIRIKEAHHYDFNETAKLYLKVSDFFNIDWLVESLSKMKVSDRWGIENVDHLMHELKDCQDDIVVSILNFKRKGEDLIQAFDNFLRENSEEAAVYQESMEELLEEGKAGIISINVIVRKLSSFIYRHE